MGTHEHKGRAPKQVKIGILTLSSTRTLEEDKSGQWMTARVAAEGHVVVFHRVVPDQAGAILAALREAMEHHQPQIMLLTGGTGVSPADVTVETVRPLFQKELTAFGALFSWLSYEEIGSAAIMSRAAAGVIGNTVVFCMPGSLNACKLACEKLIFPELGHLAAHISEG